MSLKRIRCPGGATYEGALLMGMRQGFEVINAPGDRRYEGECEDGRSHGRSTITCPDGSSSFLLTGNRFETIDSGDWLQAEGSYRPETAISAGDGVWLVGVKIEPHTYRFAEAGDWLNWEHLRGFSGDYTGITANQYVDEKPGNDFSITVKAMDRGLALSGGSIWTRAGD